MCVRFAALVYRPQARAQTSGLTGAALVLGSGEIRSDPPTSDRLIERESNSVFALCRSSTWARCIMATCSALGFTLGFSAAGMSSSATGWSAERPANAGGSTSGGQAAQESQPNRNELSMHAPDVRDLATFEPTQTEANRVRIRVPTSETEMVPHRFVPGLGASELVFVALATLRTRLEHGWPIPL
jgi:hypothetical protein